MSEKKTETTAKAAVKPNEKAVNRQAFVKRKLDVLNAKPGLKYERAARHVAEMNSARKAGRD